MFSVSRRFKRLLSMNYQMARKLAYGEYKRSIDESKEPLIVFQMGKVGSSTIVDSLEHHCLDMEIFHIHVLSHEWIEHVHQLYKNASNIHKKTIIDKHILASQYLRETLDKQQANSQLKVVTLTRDPVARNISAFFQAFPIHFPETYIKHKEKNIPLEERVEELIDLFLHKFDKHDVPVNWFENHIKPAFDTDVYASEFDPLKGYKIYDSPRAEILLLRLEDLTKCGKDAFDKFLGIPHFEIKNKNVSSEKKYSEEYALFKKGANLPEPYVERMYESQYMKHFYSKEERQKLRAKWLNS